MESCQRTCLIQVVIKDHASRCCKLIDASVSSDQNTSTKVTEKISKYKDLEIEITQIRRVKTEIVPVIVDELALISKGMQYNLGKISGAININELQKIRLRNIQRSCQEDFCSSSKISLQHLRTKEWARVQQSTRSNLQHQHCVKGGILVVFLLEITLTWEGNKLGQKKYEHGINQLVC